MYKRQVLAVGSRKSLLALTQTKIVIEKLKLKNPEVDFKIYKITTDGDITSKKFNSKKNNILMSSMGFIGLTANTEIGIEVPNDTGKVYLGDGQANQPVLGGDQTMELFELLVDYLLEFTNGLATAMGSIVNFHVPIPHIPISCSTLMTKLQTLKTRMNEPKSKTVHVGHLRGPD